MKLFSGLNSIRNEFSRSCFHIINGHHSLTGAFSGHRLSIRNIFFLIFFHPRILTYFSLFTTFFCFAYCSFLYRLFLISKRMARLNRDEKNFSTHISLISVGTCAFFSPDSSQDLLCFTFEWPFSWQPKPLFCMIWSPN